jgi:hypothetical protein
MRPIILIQRMNFCCGGRIRTCDLQFRDLIDGGGLYEACSRTIGDDFSDHLDLIDNGAEATNCSTIGHGACAERASS